MAKTKKTTVKKSTPAAAPVFPAFPTPTKSPADIVLDYAPAILESFRKITVGQDLASRAALSVLPSVSDLMGYAAPAHNVVRRAFEIGDAFAATVAKREAAAAAQEGTAPNA